MRSRQRQKQGERLHVSERISLFSAGRANVRRRGFETFFSGPEVFGVVFRSLQRLFSDPR